MNGIQLIPSHATKKISLVERSTFPFANRRRRVNYPLASVMGKIMLLLSAGKGTRTLELKKKTVDIWLQVSLVVVCVEHSVAAAINLRRAESSTWFPLEKPREQRHKKKHQFNIYSFDDSI